MVAMFGAIMPEPLAMPASDTSTPSTCSASPLPFGNVSVVMKARAAASQSGAASLPVSSGTMEPT